MLMDSSSALRVLEIAGEIENCAFNNVDGMTVKSFYEAALWQCFYMSGVHANIDEIRSEVISTLKKSEKEHAHILAKTVIAYNLSLADILPCTAKEPEKIDNESPRKKNKTAHHCDTRDSDDKLDVSCRPNEAKVLNTIGASSTDSSQTEMKECYEKAVVHEVHAGMPTLPLNEHSNSSHEELCHKWLREMNEELCHNWLREMNYRLGKYDARLLRRYIPQLSNESLRQVVQVCLRNFNAYREDKKMQSVSKMAMRRVLSSTFAELKSTVEEIRELQKVWEATKPKTNRKSKGCLRTHSARYQGNSSHDSN